MSDKNKTDISEQVPNPSRRDLLKSAGLVGAVVASSGTVSNVAVAAETNASASGNTIPQREALENLTALEAETLEAMADRILPSDENGPGAKEARAVHFIDRSLASDNSSDRENYGIGLNAVYEHAINTHSKAFHELTTSQQDAILSAMQANELEGFSPSAGSFFNMVRGDTIDGTFSDPYYGGNRNFVGWDMLGYPGVRLGTSPEDVELGRNLAPNHRSAYDNVAYTKSGNSGSEA